MPLIYPQGFGTSNNLYFSDAVEGMLVDSIPHDYVTPNLINNGGQLPQITTIAVGTAAVSTDYTIRIQGVYDSIDATITYTSGASDTAAQIATGLVNKLIANNQVYGVLIPSVSGNTVVLTFRRAGLANTYSVLLSGGGAGYAATATQAGSNASVIPFGYVVATGTSDTARTAKLPISSNDIPRGIAIRTSAHQITETGVDGVNPGDMVNTLNNGRVWVKPTTAFKVTDVVYYSYDSVTKGTVRAGSAANHAILPGAKFERNGVLGDLAILKVNM